MVRLDTYVLFRFFCTVGVASSLVANQSGYIVPSPLCQNVSLVYILYLVICFSCFCAWFSMVIATRCFDFLRVKDCCGAVAKSGTADVVSHGLEDNNPGLLSRRSKRVMRLTPFFEHGYWSSLNMAIGLDFPSLPPSLPNDLIHVANTRLLGFPKQ